MRRAARIAAALGLGLPLLLSGCSLFPTTRKLPVPKPPTLVQTATPEQLVARLNQRYNALNSLTATVEIQATELKTKEGVAETFPTTRGWILIRKPAMLRVLGNYLGARAFDMVSNGATFTLQVPLKNVAFEGSNHSLQASPNPMYNLRPQFFSDAMVVQGVENGDHYSMTTNTATVEDAAKKHLYSVPEYTLDIVRLKPNSPEMTQVRVITFHRDDLLPYKQDVYDEEGDLESDDTYAGYQNFDSVQFPSIIDIKAPIAQVELRLTVEEVHENVELKDNQFEMPLPKGIKVVHLD